MGGGGNNSITLIQNKKYSAIPKLQYRRLCKKKLTATNFADTSGNGTDVASLSRGRGGAPPRTPPPRARVMLEILAAKEWSPRQKLQH